jgi:hypothetical protein
MRGHTGFFDVDERLKELSAKGDELERLNAIVNFRDVSRGPGARRAEERPIQGRPATLRPRADVQGSDSAVEAFAIGRADGISDQGPPFVHALARVVACPKRAGRELDLELSRGADELRGKVGDGVNQAADLISATVSIPSLNFIPLTTFGNWF